MRELHYTPEQLNRFTIPQLTCLLMEKPPGDRKLESAEDYQQMLKEDAEREAEWIKN